MIRAFAFFAAALLVTSTAYAASLEVTATGFKHARGGVIACLWKDGKGFPTCQKGKPVKRITATIKDGASTFTFADIAPGDYAVTVQHDEDGDGKLKTNFIGMPKEGIGVSNNPSGMPRIGKSMVTVKDATKTTVAIRYL
jgi:uncharacterized protein (DUF2141 family)